MTDQVGVAGDGVLGGADDPDVLAKQAPEGGEVSIGGRALSTLSRNGKARLRRQAPIQSGHDEAIANARAALARYLDLGDWYDAAAARYYLGVALRAAGRTGEARNVPVFVPERRFCTDNAAMIAAAAERRGDVDLRDPLTLTADPGLPFA